MADAYFNNVSTLLHFNGADNSISIVDNSLVPKVYTCAGNARLSSTVPLFGSAAAQFDGVGDWISTTTSLSDFAFGTGDFTVEVGVYLNAYNDVLLDFGYGPSNGGWQLFVNSAGYIEWWGNSLILTSTHTVPLTTWNQIIVQRVSGQLKIFVHGIDSATVGDARDYSGTSVTVFAIGAQVQTRNASYDLNGKLDELRITKGVGRYAGADPHFSNVSLLLGFESNSFVDDSLNAFTPTITQPLEVNSPNAVFGNFAGYFTGGYLQYANNAAFDLGGGDFTIEQWINFIPAAMGARVYWMGKASSIGGGGTFAWGKNTSNQVNFAFTVGGIGYTLTDSTPVVANTNYFYSVTRSGNTFTLYRGTTPVATQVATGSFPVNAFLFGIGNIGEYVSTYLGSFGVLMSGYLDEVRITKGVARTITVPTAAFPRSIINTAEFDGTGVAVVYGQQILQGSLFNYSSPTVGLTKNSLTVTDKIVSTFQNYTGTYKIEGKTVLGNNVPFAATVLLFPKNAPSRCIRSAKTDDVTGMFSFTNLAAGEYLVSAYDVTEEYRRQNYSSITAVPM